MEKLRLELLTEEGKGRQALKKEKKRICLAAICVFAMTSQVQARCDLAHYVFQDQSGAEAEVRQVRECFGFYNSDHVDRSSPNGKCLTEDEAERAISRTKTDNIRLVGTRLITLLYENKFLNISETAIVGSPWLSYEVEPDLRQDNVSSYQFPAVVYKLLDGGEIKFDFTKDAPQGFDTPENLYKSLLGKQFIFKRCT